MNYVTIGKIVQTRGLQGEVKIFSQTSFPSLRYKKGNTVYIETASGYKAFVVKQYRRFQTYDLVIFKDFDAIEKIEPFVGQYVFAEKETIPLKKGTYFFSDLLQCEVYYKETRLGHVDKVEDQTAQVLLRIKRVDLSDLLIPFISVFILNVDLTTKRIDVNLVDGML